MSFDSDRDDFWDIDKLVPRKRPTAKPFATQITPDEHVISGADTEKREENKLTFESLPTLTQSEPYSYEPKACGLIKRVTVRPFNDKYDFYGSFRKAALVYYDYKTEKCDFAPFYSYMPQYSQLTQPQKSYYFYWRDCVRREKYIKCDYSYLYLYVYEILNLPDKIEPSRAILLLCRLWREYRTSLPRIDAYFSVWVRDFCMVYNIDCPTVEIRDFIFDVIDTTPFKEFYLSDADITSDSGIDALLAYLSDYDWRHGKYAGGDNKEKYAEYLHDAMKRFLFHLREDGLMHGSSETVVTRHDAFAHSLCTHAVKCKLEIEYIPLSRDERARAIVTAGVRYTENKLRALFGIKSRLAVKDFPDKYKRTIDVYFDALTESERRRIQRENAPSYERLYDAPREALSFVGASDIEESSWTTTARLVVDEPCDEIVYAEPKHHECDSVSETHAMEDADNYGLSENDIKILAEMLNGAFSLCDDSVAERINDAFADGFGDVVLEFCDGKYIIIEDYEEDVREWLLKLTR